MRSDKQGVTVLDGTEWRLCKVIGRELHDCVPIVSTWDVDLLYDLTDLRLTDIVVTFHLLRCFHVSTHCVIRKEGLTLMTVNVR